jgi:hypothetical protein
MYLINQLEYRNKSDPRKY